VVQEHLSVHRPYLRALVADDRTVKPDLLRPRQGARKGPASASDDFDSRLPDPAYRFHVARVQLQRRAEDGPIEVEGQQSIPTCGAQCPAPEDRPKVAGSAPEIKAPASNAASMSVDL
jgi:hypothetical protein